MNKILVAITTWNRQPYTKRCIETLLNNTDYSMDIVIVDNGSEKPTLDFLKKLENKKYKNGTTIKVIYNGANLGVGGALNKTLELRQSEQHFMKLDNDMIIPENHRTWMEEMIEILEKNKDCISIIGLSPFGTDTISHARKYNIYTVNNKEFQIDDPSPLPILGPAKIMSYYVMNKLLKYSEENIYGYEDTAIGYKNRELGFKGVYYTHCKAVHGDFLDLPESSANQEFKAKYLHNRRANIYTNVNGFGLDDSELKINLEEDNG